MYLSQYPLLKIPSFDFTLCRAEGSNHRIGHYKRLGFEIYLRHMTQIRK